MVSPTSSAMQWHTSRIVAASWPLPSAWAMRGKFWPGGSELRGNIQVSSWAKLCRSELLADGIIPAAEHA
jgi:hypothetical protein